MSASLVDLIVCVATWAVPMSILVLLGMLGDRQPGPETPPRAFEDRPAGASPSKRFGPDPRSLTESPAPTVSFSLPGTLRPAQRGAARRLDAALREAVSS